MIGDYARPKTRLPGAGGAPEIATHARQIFVVLKQNARAFVPQARISAAARAFSKATAREADRASAARARRSSSPTSACSGPQPDTDELQLVARYEGVSVDEVVKATGWPLRVADRVDVVAPPTDEELANPARPCTRAPARRTAAPCAAR